MARGQPSVTLQVALVGSGGWVLASDRRQLDDSGTRIASTRPKLVIEPALGLAFSYAGDALAIKAGYALADALKTRRISTDEPQAFLSGLVSIGNTVWREASRDFKLVGLINPAHTARGLFVCLANTLLQFSI